MLFRATRAINFVKRRDRKDGFGSLSIGYGVEKDSDDDPRPLTLDWSGIPDARRGALGFLKPSSCVLSLWHGD